MSQKKKLHLLRILILSFTGLLISTLLIAQKPNYKFKSINQPDGLTNSTVQTIFEDSFGFIWLGTHQGVQRYDGKIYKTYEQNVNDSTGLSANYINGFCEDPDGNIWITTQSGLNKYNRKTDKIERYRWQNKLLTEESDLPFVNVTVDESDKNILWVTAYDVGLVKLNINNDSATLYRTSENTFLSWILPYPGKPDHLLVGSRELYSFNKTSGKFSEILRLEQDSQIPYNNINDAVIDPANNNIIWLATGDFWGRGGLSGVIRLNLETGSMKQFSADTGEEDFPYKYILRLCFYDENNLWIGTRKNGAVLYKVDEDRFYNYIENEYDDGSFTTANAVRSMLVDRSGTMWFGTWGDGISLLSPAAQKFSHYKHLQGETNGLPDNYIMAITEDKNGDIWIGTRVGGLSKFNPREDTFENYAQESFSSTNKTTEITCLFYDSRENLWIGTYDDALYRYSQATGIKKHYRYGDSNKDVTKRRISAITEIKPGEILISTYGGGLNIYHYQTDRFQHFKYDPNDSTSIPDNQVWHPFLGNDGNYYLGGNALAGYIQFNPETENFMEISPLSIVSTFMSSTKTSDGRVFVDDVSHGLTEIIIADDIDISYAYDQNGQSIKNVESLLCDSKDNLWLGTGNGLLEYNIKTKNVKRYAAVDGLQGYEFTRSAAFKSSTGTMYFGAKSGLSVFHPDKIRVSKYEPPVVFTDFKLFQGSVEIGESTPIKENFLLMDELILAHYQNDFSISFAALDFSNPQNIEYKYILEKHDDDWISVGHNNVASYTNMDPGKYTLKVLATNGDGVWNKKAKSIRIVINPPWWQTRWAYILYGFIFLAVVFAVDRIQRKRLREKQRAKTREKELAQAKEIQKAYTKLKATQKQLIHAEKMASLGELTAGIAHEIQNPLNFVNNFSEVNFELIEELKEEIDQGNMIEVKAIADDIADNEELIMHHGKRADGIVKGMLLHSRSQNDDKVATNINSLADEYLRLSYHGLRAKDKSFNADFETDFDDSLPQIKTVSQDLGRVILNLINNAFHAVAEKQKLQTENYKPLVKISTGKVDDQVEIRVIDNGNGIPSNLMDKIFQPFFTTKSTGEGTGLGLSLSYDIITKGHGGSLSVVTNEGVGSEFIILLPVN